MQRTRIEWVINPDGSQGYTWNPVTGCLNSCSYCYARRISNRFYPERGFRPILHTDRLNDPLKLKKPSTIFVCSMADLFGKWIPDVWISRVMDVVWNCPEHTFIFLTKNPARYRTFYSPPNSWIGYTDDGTKDKQDWIYVRGRNNTFVSLEPLIGDKINIDFEQVKWVIVGALNRNARPVPPEKGGTSKKMVLKVLQEAGNIPVFIKDSLFKLYPDLPRRREIPY